MCPGKVRDYIPCAERHAAQKVRGRRQVVYAAARNDERGHVDKPVHGRHERNLPHRRRKHTSEEIVVKTHGGTLLVVDGIVSVGGRQVGNHEPRHVYVCEGGVLRPVRNGNGYVWDPIDCKSVRCGAITYIYVSLKVCIELGYEP